MEYGLIGERLGHSYSKIIHSLLGDYKYELRDVAPHELDGFLRARRFKGINVTIPYKKAAAPYCDYLGGAAKETGSVNTLTVDARGSMRGDNTDYAGLVYMARRTGILFKGRRVLILGSGGTSSVARAVASDSGAREITIVSRDGAVNYESVYEQKDAEVIINTTPVGMYPNNCVSPIDPGRFSKLFGVLDVVYNPLETALVLRSKELGITASGGLPMLAAQAAAAYELFFRKVKPESEIERIIRAVRAQMTNIVLIGMPGSGKSSIGKIVAARLKREFIDLDAEIESRAGESVAGIFERYGEARFRAIESEAAADFGKKNGLVISTGGGIVLHNINYVNLKQNGRIYRIARDTASLETCGRPLSNNPEAVEKMAMLRSPLYKRFTDVSIENNGTLDEAAEKIAEDFYEFFSD